MVTVSKAFNSGINNPVSSGSYCASTNANSYIEKNFQAQNKNTKKKDNQLLKEDHPVPNTFLNRMKINWDKTTSIPLVHFPRGLAGAPDYTFYEFLQTAKFPYYIGGPILAGLFYAGIKKDNFQNAMAAKRVAKHMAIGVALYYVGASIAKSIVNTTVKIRRGIDLNQPYKKPIFTTTNQTGAFKKDTEWRKVFESTEFTRTDLLYKKGKTPKEINAEYAEIGKKYNLDPNANDVDSTVIPLIKKTIIMARAWQYALTAFFVTLGVGMANQKAWDNEATGGFKAIVKDGVFGKNVKFKDRLDNAKIAIYDSIIKPLGVSFKEFWKGQSKASSIAGKSVIVSTALATTLALWLLINKTSAKKHRLETAETKKTDEAAK